MYISDLGSSIPTSLQRHRQPLPSRGSHRKLPLKAAGTYTNKVGVVLVTQGVERRKFRSSSQPDIGFPFSFAKASVDGDLLVSTITISLLTNTYLTQHWVRGG